MNERLRRVFVVRRQLRPRPDHDPDTTPYPPARPANGHAATGGAAQAGDSDGAPSTRTRAKGKGRAPPAPKKKQFKWHCPVESCDKEHTSEGVPLDATGNGGDSVYHWKAKAGKGGVIPLYI